MRLLLSYVYVQANGQEPIVYTSNGAAKFTSHSLVLVREFARLHCFGAPSFTLLPH